SGDVLGIVALPEAVRVAERGQSALGRDAGTGQDDDLHASTPRSASVSSRTAVDGPASDQTSPCASTWAVAPPRPATSAVPGSQSQSGVLCWNQQPSRPVATPTRSIEPDPSIRIVAGSAAARTQAS